VVPETARSVSSPGLVRVGLLGARAGVAELLPVQSFGTAAPSRLRSQMPRSHRMRVRYRRRASPVSSRLIRHGCRTLPVLRRPLIQGRDVRIFPGVQLEFFTVGEVLVPVQRGEMVRETDGGPTPSYWRIIPQFGKVWREPGDGDWSRAAFPVMLVNDTENHAHQGLAAFLYRPGR